MVVAILSRHMMLSWPRGGWWGGGVLKKLEWWRSVGQHLQRTGNISRIVTHTGHKELRGVYVERSSVKRRKDMEKETRLIHTYGRSSVDWDGRGESEICRSA